MDRSLLNRATGTNEEPVSGVDLVEITKICSYHDLTEKVVEYMISKIKKDNPYVKQKCLRIIRHVAESGKADFKRQMGRHAAVIKENLQYRGSPDPLKGDAPNKAVRDEAELALKAIFSDGGAGASGGGFQQQGFGSEQRPPPPPEVNFNTGMMNQGGMNQGYQGMGGQPPPPPGGNPGMGSSNGMGSSYRKMEGFGNPNFDNSIPRHETNAEADNLEKANMILKQGLAAGGEYLKAGALKAVDALPENLKDQVTSKLSQIGSLYPGGGDVWQGENKSGSYTGSGGGYNPSGYSNAGGGGYSYPGGYSSNPSGGYQDSMSGSAYQAPNTGSSWGSNSWGNNNSNTGGTSWNKTPAANAGQYESQLVEDLCIAGGARVAPSADQLNSVLMKIESGLDSEILATKLADKLESGTWQQKVKVLCLLEACSEKGFDGIVGGVCEKGGQGNLITSCCSDQNPQVRQRAQKVAGVLGIDTPGTGSNSGGVAKANNSYSGGLNAGADLLDMGGGGDLLDMGGSTNAGGDLLDMGFDSVEKNTVSTADLNSQEKTPSPKTLLDDDLLLGMGSSATNSNTVAGAAPGASGNNTMANGSTGTGGSLFGNLNVHSAQQQPSQPVQQQEQSGLGDLLGLGGSSGSGAMPQQQQQQRDMNQNPMCMNNMSNVNQMGNMQGMNQSSMMNNLGGGMNMGMMNNLGGGMNMGNMNQMGLQQQMGMNSMSIGMNQMGQMGGMNMGMQQMNPIGGQPQQMNQVGETNSKQSEGPNLLQGQTGTPSSAFGFLNKKDKEKEKDPLASLLADTMKEL